MRAFATALLLVPALLGTNLASASCRPAYRQEIETRTEKLAKFKHTKKKVVLYSMLGLGLPVGVAMGYLFYRIADGATIATGVLSGGLFGGLAAGGAALATYVPLEIIQLVKQSRLRAYVTVNSLLEEAAASNTEGYFVNRLYREVHSAHPEMQVADLVAALNDADAREVFCRDGKLAKPGAVRKYFRARQR